MSKPTFIITNHARRRFAERVSPNTNMEEALDKAKECNAYERMAIDADYVEYTKRLKTVNNTETYFAYKNIVFAAIKDDIKQYIIQTCWVRPKFTSTGSPAEEIADNGATPELTMHNLIQYLHSKKPFSIEGVSNVITNKPFPKEIRQSINFVKRAYPKLDKGVFIQHLSKFDLYRKVYEKSKRYHNPTD